MPFPTTLTEEQLTQIRGHGFYAPAFLLLCPNTVIFRAQVDQASFNASFAEITYDNVTIGAYTDIKEGFTCYISNTTNPREATFIFRIRKVATSTQIFINQTSAAINDNQYIIVTKDIRPAVKLPQIDENFVQYKDFDIAYRTPKPLVYDLQTCYVAKLNISGYADISLTPKMLPVEIGAGVSSWLWDLDGGTFSLGSSTTRDITARYTSAGHYMPRVTATDTNGVANWFSPHIFIIPSDYEDNNIYEIIETTIDNNLDSGITAQITSRCDLSGILDYTFACIYAPSNKTEITDAIQFVGRWPDESNPLEVDRGFYLIPETSFNLDGLTNIMGQMISRNIPMRYNSSPTEWDEIKELTVWRAVAYYLAEHTTIPNIHSVEFDDTGLDYRTTNYTAGDANVLDTLTSILETINARVSWAPQGEIRFSRQSVYLSSTDRDAVTTIANWQLDDVLASGNSGRIVDLSREYLPIVGIDEAFGAIYNTVTGKLQVIQARTPAVVQSDGNELVSLNRQVLNANTSINEGYDELGERLANDFAARQPVDTLSINHPPEYRFLIPGEEWFTWTLPTISNNRGISYDTNTRWLLTAISTNYNIARGYPNVDSTYQRESQSLGYQIVVSIPRTTTPLSKPITPLIDDYPNLDETPNIASPSGFGFEGGQEPPFSEDDVGGINNPQDPGTTEEQNQSGGDFGIIWDASQVWTFSGMISKENPDYTDVTPTDLEGFTTITDAKLGPQSNNNYGWILSNNGTDSRLWRTKAIGDLRWVYTQIAGIYTHIRITSTRIGTNSWLYVLNPDIQTVDPWEHLFNIETISGPASRDITYEDDNFILLTNTNYVGGKGLVHGDTSGGRQIRSVHMQIPFPAADSTTITKIILFYDYVEGSAPDDGTQLRFSAPSVGDIIFTFDDGELTEGTKQTTTYEGSIPMSAGELLTIRMNSSLDVFEGSVTLRRVTLEGTGANPFVLNPGYVKTLFSQNNGVSWHPDSPRFANESNNGLTGFDVQGAGGSVFVGSLDQIRGALDEGPYGLVTYGVTTGTSALCIRYHGVNQSRYVFGSAASVSGESVWKVRAAPAQVPITPNDGTNDGIVVSQNSIDVSPRDETKIFILADFGGTVKLAYSIDDGNSWSFQTGITSLANYIRVKQNFLVYIANGNNVKVSVDGGATLLTRTCPSTSLKGIEVK